MASKLSNYYLVLSLVLLSLNLSITEATKVQFIDNEELETIAHTVCSTTSGESKQIGQVSTIKGLVDFFNNLKPNDRLLTACLNDINHPLHLLNDIVSRKNDNVCSDEKISLIEEFHHKYISKTNKDNANIKVKAPKLLVLFFYHYVVKIGDICKWNLIQQLNEAQVTGAKLKETNRENLLIVDKFLTKFSNSLGSISGSFKTYDEIVLLWSFIDKLPLKENNEYINESGKRCTISFDLVEEVKEFQKECATRLRPIYGQFALPVIKLIDLGYYQDNESFSEDLADRQDLRRLIGIAQVCEFILPIRVVTKNKMGLSDMVILTKKEASELPEAAGDNELELAPIPDNNWSSYADSEIILDTINPNEAYAFVKSIKKNIKIREKVLLGVFGQIAKSVRSKIKSMVGKVFYSAKCNSPNRYCWQDVAPLIEQDRGYRNFVVEKPKHFYDQPLQDLKTLRNEYKKSPFGGNFSLLLLVVKWVFDIIRLMFKGLIYALMYVIVNPLIRVAYQTEGKRSLLHKII